MYAWSQSWAAASAVARLVKSHCSGLKNAPL